MRILLYTNRRVGAFCALFCLQLVFVAGALGQKTDLYVPGELLVKFYGGPKSEKASAANRRLEAVAVENLGDLGWQRVRLPEGARIDDAIERYKALDGVAAVQPNFYYHLLATPNDPDYLHFGLYGLGKISAPTAWDLTTGSSAVVVADIDTGVRYTHDDLAANMWTNMAEIAGNGVDDDANGYVDDIYGVDTFFNDGDPIDENGHGTHTSGTIGARGNNMLGVVGVNWTVKIMAIKIYDNDGFGTTSAMLINAYNYVRLMKNRGVNVRVTNNSYGGCDEACRYDQATKDAIDALGDAGVLQIFAAGNSARNIDTNPFFPASYTSPSVVSVASSDQVDTRSSFSNFGVASVDLAAPGSGVLSTMFQSNSSYGVLSGTSMATPHVAGAAALLSAYNPDLSPASVKATLMNTVDPIAAWSSIVKTGGRLNVDRALRNQTVCTVAPAANTIAVPTKGGTISVDVTAAANCEYAVRSNVNWIKVSGAETGSGTGPVTFRVTVNPTITRSGTISVAGQNITVTQSRAARSQPGG